jgi:hypothetical protein
MSTSRSQHPALGLLPNLLLIFAVGAGIFITEPRLPDDRRLRLGQNGGSQNVNKKEYTFTWEDPLNFPTVNKDDANRTENGHVKLPTNTLTHERGALAKFIKENNCLDGLNQVVFIGMEGGSLPMAVERRIRTRIAVTSALADKLRMIRCPKMGLRKVSFNPPLGDETMEEFFAVECFVSDGLPKGGTPASGEKAVAFVYVDETALPPTPANLQRLKEIVDAGRVRCAYIGITRSDALRDFFKNPEDTMPSSGEPTMAIYSPYATLNSRYIPGLPERLGAKSGTIPHFPQAAGRLELDKKVTADFYKVGADDGMLCEALVEELKNRGLGRDKPDKNPGDILILADMERYHSRALIRSFEESASRSLGKVHTIHYPEALDAFGSTPAQTSKAPANTSGNTIPTARSNPGGSHAAEGSVQFDSLARLPARIRQLEDEKGYNFRAIGLFGSDVHDKLQILRMLKPAFSGALFFTNDLDSRLWQGENREDSINLLVAGAYGLTLDDALQGGTPPFRSSYQTTAYLSCLHAVANDAKVEPETEVMAALSKLCHAVELHEVGRKGDQLLAYYQQEKPHLVSNVPGRPASIEKETLSDRIAQRHYRMLILILLGFLLWHSWKAIQNSPAPLNIAQLRHRKSAKLRHWKKILKSKRILKFLWAALIRLIKRLPLPMTLLLVTALCAMAWDVGEVSGVRDGFGEGGSIFSGSNGKVVIAANFLIVAIGVVMICLEMKSRQIRLPYPLHQNLLNDEIEELSKGMTDAERQTASRIRKPTGGSSMLDFIGLLRNWFPPMAPCIWPIRYRAKNVMSWDKEPNRAQRNAGRPDIVWSFAKERLVLSNGNLVIRVLCFIVIAFLAYWLLNHGYSPDLGAPASIRGDSLRTMFLWGDKAAKAMLAIIAAIALDRQITLVVGLGKLTRYFEDRSLQEAADDKLAAPYAWHHRPEVEIRTRKDAEASFAINESGDEGFWEMPLVRAAAKFFSDLSPSLVLPFILVFLLLVSRNPVFENVPLPTGELLLLVFILLGPLAAGVWAQTNLSRLFAATRSRLRSGARFVCGENACKPEKDTDNSPKDAAAPMVAVSDAPTPSESESQASESKSAGKKKSAAVTRAAFFKGELESCDELEKRTNYSFFNNPIVEAILLPLGGYGFLQFSSYLAGMVR